MLWNIEGASALTGLDVTIRVSASSKEEACDLASKQNVLVNSATPVHPKSLSPLVRKLFLFLILLTIALVACYRWYAKRAWYNSPDSFIHDATLMEARLQGPLSLPEYQEMEEVSEGKFNSVGSPSGADQATLNHCAAPGCPLQRVANHRICTTAEAGSPVWQIDLDESPAIETICDSNRHRRDADATCITR
jgi:hypothetical protein